MANLDQPPRLLPELSNHWCIQCGYFLRGLRLGGTCPECGFPIVEAVTHPMQRFVAASLRFLTGLLLIMTAMMLLTRFCLLPLFSVGSLATVSATLWLGTGALLVATVVLQVRTNPRIRAWDRRSSVAIAASVIALLALMAAALPILGLS